jgi:hypothetical protein
MNELDIVYVYVLLDPRPKHYQHFYIGVSKWIPSREGWNTEVHARIAEIRAFGYDFVKIPLDLVEVSSLRNLTLGDVWLVESSWICYFREVLCEPLLNRNDGGFGCLTHSEATKQILSQKCRGNRANRGMKDSAEVRKRKSESNKGKHGYLRKYHGQMKGRRHCRSYREDAPEGARAIS